MTGDPRDLLASLGLAPGEVLGRGIEGVVVALDDDRVAKVWRQPSHERAEAARDVLDAVAAAGLPFATPRVLDVLDADGVTVTVEARLPGVELGRSVAPDDGETALVDEHRVACLVTVLRALAAVEVTPAMSGLPVLPGEPSFAPDVPFADSLAALVERRVAESAGPLRDALGADLEPLVDGLLRTLGGLPDAPSALLHGDLVPMNVHVDRPGGTVVAVLDLGFLTTVGDPAFDAAVTASVFDMYGPRHRASEAVLDEAFTAGLGLDRFRLAVHRAAYALATATVYDPTGRDGHFDWCVAMLRRDDVRAAIG